MDIWHFHPQTGELLGQDVALPDPEEGEGFYLIPAFATGVEPPVVGEDEIAIFDDEFDNWSLVPDLRGTTYWLDGVHYTITEIGVTVPPGGTDEPDPADVLANWREATTVPKTALRRAMRATQKGGAAVSTLVDTRLTEVDPDLAEDWAAASQIARLSVETREVIEAVLTEIETDELFDMALTLAEAPPPPETPPASGDPIVVGQWYSAGDVVEIDGVTCDVISPFLYATDNWRLEHLLAHLQAQPVGTEWAPGIAVTVGEEYTYEGTTYRVIQSHTTQAAWTPPATPALWLPL